MMLETSGPPELPREFRGVWVATVDNIDWPSKPGLSDEAQRSELSKLLKSIASLRFNAVVFQVRPSADALYQSKLEPSSWYLTGEQGRPLTFDPLEFAVEEGHKLGLEVHAWFNPFRACHPAQKGPYCDDHLSVSHPELAPKYGKYLWMDPGLPEAREHSYKVFMDVVDRYDVDGIHIDDYFYPYPVGDERFPDAESYQTYGGGSSLGDWRRSNVDSFVERVYKGIKSRKPWVKFGISPFGIYRPNVPTGIKAGIDQYEDLSADALRWLQEGWCDYMSPQLYWKTDSPGQPFGKLLNWWTSVNTRGRHLWPGLYTSLLNKSVTNEEIGKQISLTRKNGRATGQVHFSAVALEKDYKGVRKFLRDGLYGQPALVPSSIWLGASAPASPKVSRSTGAVEWVPVKGARFYAIAVRRGDIWHQKAITGKTSFGTEPGTVVSVTAIGLTGVASAPSTVVVPK